MGRCGLLFAHYLLIWRAKVFLCEINCVILHSDFEFV